MTPPNLRSPDVQQPLQPPPVPGTQPHCLLLLLIRLMVQLTVQLMDRVQVPAPVLVHFHALLVVQLPAQTVPELVQISAPVHVSALVHVSARVQISTLVHVSAPVGAPCPPAGMDTTPAPAPRGARQPARQGV